MNEQAGNGQRRPVIECVDVHRSFGPVVVLRGVDLALEAGTVTALAGENGAGKSTLMKILAGQVLPSSGHVIVDGETVRSADAHAARAAGLAIVPQELAPVPDMTVYENLFLGRELKDRLGMLDRRAMARAARGLLADFGLTIDPKVRMCSLSVAMQQIVEIIKNTTTGCRVLLLDEPTSAISDREVAHLYTVIEELKGRGVAIVYTTHKMEEIRAVADRIVVLRDGKLIADSLANDISDSEIVTAMIGRELDELFPQVLPPHDAPARLKVADLEVDGFGSSVSFTVRPGEIVALAGLVGAGRTELIETVMGIRDRVHGHVTVNDCAVRKNSPASAIAAHMAIVPEDRKGAGLVQEMDVLTNSMLPRLNRFSSGGWLLTGKARTEVASVMNQLSLKSSGLSQRVGTLSGGNQQKVVLGRWLTGTVDVLLLDEPTRGVDVGARSQIYQIIADLAASGMAIVMASSDMPEILGLAHRVLVMRQGRIEGELSRSDLASPDAQERIFSFAAGLTKTH